MNLLQLHEPGETPSPHEGDEVVAVGIDLGTTNSVVAYANAQNAEALKDIHGNTLIPSVVYYLGGGVRVGSEARTHAARGEVQAISSIKRLMGRGAADIQPLLGQLPYDIVSEEGMVRLRIDGKVLTPVEISADILRHVRAVAERALGREVRQAVVTVPAYFDDAARAATKDAAQLAGLTVLRLVNEPTAAALAYGLDSGAEGIYAIYDLGGGTFDISLLRMEKGVFQVLATGGDAQLGGDDFDRVIAEEVARGAAMRSGGEEGRGKFDTSSLNMLLAAARTAKEQLTTHDSAECQGITITRAQFEVMAEPLVERTLRACAAALDDAQLKPGDIQGVVLVGGATRMPLVRARVETFFGRPPLADVNPDEVVAIGAALQAEALTHGSSTLLLDVIPLSLGLETMGGLTEKLIARNTPIPVTVSQEFTTWQDNQTGMQIHVLQGEREMVGDNRSLARFELAGIPPLPAGIARVKVTFTVDADGLLTVSAEERHTNIMQAVQVKPSYGLPPEEIERMLRQSMEHARADITERLLAEARMEAARAIEELHSAMKADATLLSTDEYALIERQIVYVQEAIASDDRERIDVEIQQLSAAAGPFAQRRMDNAIQGALKGAHMNNVEQTLSKEKITGESHA